MTVPKNSKKAKTAVQNAHDITCYSESNYFNGKPLAESPVVWGGPIVNNQYRDLVPVSQSEFLARELAGRNAKLTDNGNGHFTLRVHSNLWYEFAVAKEAL